MSKNIVLFTSSLNAFNLISYLSNKALLSCVVVSNKNNFDTTNLINVLQENQIPFFIYENDDNKNIEILKKINGNFALIFGFSLKISKSIIEHFKNQIFNIHASSLPKYRGINPIFWQVKNGEESFALTLHKVTQEFDEGEVLYQKQLEINYQDTFGTLNALINSFVVSFVEEFLIDYENKKLKLLKQEGDISYAKEVTKKDIVINWEEMTSLEIYNLTRACNPIFEGAKTLWKNSVLSVFETTIMNMNNLGIKAGTIIHIAYPEGLIVSTKDGAIRIDTVCVSEGIFSGLRFAKRFNVEVTEEFLTINL